MFLSQYIGHVLIDILVILVYSYICSQTCSPKFTLSCTGLSFAFELKVSREVIEQIERGLPTPDDILVSSTESVEQEHASKPFKSRIETSVGDCRLWAEVLRNLSKDLSKHSSIMVSEATLQTIGADQRRQPLESGGKRDERLPMAVPTCDEIAAFSCGHAFSASHFHAKVLLEFSEHVQDFPMPIPQTLKHILLYYKQSSVYPSACPYCVFQYLRKIQLQENPGVPIKPWNP